MARFYTVKETAQTLGLSTNTIYEYLETGRLKGVRGSAKQGRFRIPQSQIDSFPSHRLETISEIPSQAPPDNGVIMPLLPIRIVRVLLIISLFFIVSEILLTRNFSPKEQAFRLVTVGIFIILSYQFISFGKNKKSS